MINIYWVNWEELGKGKGISRRDLFRIKKEVSKSFKRHVFEKCLNLPLSEIPFTKNEYGKPTALGIKFNISYSQKIICLGTSKLNDIGIDIEDSNQLFPENIKSIFPRVLTEKTTVNSDFFELWTKFEASLKTTGLGIKNPKFHPEITARNIYKIGETNVHLKTFQLYGKTVCSIGSLKPIEKYKVIEIKLDEILNAAT